MELDEIKNVWNDLNKRIEKTEELNKRMISEMLNTRQQSARDKLMKYEVVFLILSFVFGIFIPAVYFAGIYSLSTTLLFEFVFVFAGIWQVYKIYLLRNMKIESCPTAQLIQKAIRFKMITRMRTIVGLLLAVPIFILMFVFDHRLIAPEIITGMAVGLCVGLAIGLILFFRNLKDIDSLVKSYKDIRDFEKN